MLRDRHAWLLLGAMLLATPARGAVETTQLPLSGGRLLQVQLRVPDTPGPHPAVMLFGGFKEANRVLDRVQTTAPVTFATFDYPYDPPRKFQFPASLRHLPAFKQGIADTFEGIDALHRHLRGRADVDPRKITVCGASAGAPFATIGAVRYRIPGALIVHGFGKLEAVATHQFTRKYEARYGAWVRAPFRALVGVLAWYLELPHPEDYAPRFAAEQRVLMVSAQADSFVPAHARDALWTALQRSPATTAHLVLPGDHVRGGATDQIADIISRSLEWMEAHDLL